MFVYTSIEDSDFPV